MSATARPPAAAPAGCDDGRPAASTTGPTVYRRTWKGSVVTLVRDAAALRAGDGRAARRLRRRRPAPTLEGAPSYLAFVAPGLLAAHAMQTATGESTWPVMGAIKWHRTYYAMVATPLRSPTSSPRTSLFVLFRVATACGGVPARAGAVRRLRVRASGVLLAWLGAGAGRAGVRGAVLRLLAPSIKSESAFALIYRLLVIPLFLFSGAFFPIGNLPAAAGVAGPADAAVARRRPDPDARARRTSTRRLAAGARRLPRACWPWSAGGCAVRRLDAAAGGLMALVDRRRRRRGRRRSAARRRGRALVRAQLHRLPAQLGGLPDRLPRAGALPVLDRHRRRPAGRRLRVQRPASSPTPRSSRPACSPPRR